MTKSKRTKGNNNDLQHITEKTKDPKFMVYGELGRHPLNIRVQLRIISFWCKLIQSENKLSGILYRL